MKKIQYIFEEGPHKWGVVARDPERPNYIVDTNEYLVSSNGENLLCDPGGMEVFPAVFSAINDSINATNINAIFASHQDPDIISSLALWLEVNPQLNCYTSWLWGGFIPHFGGVESTFKLLADEGDNISLGDITLEAIPAHHLHSAGNFHLYDRKAKILFSGDVGAALLPPGDNSIHVSDFDKHISYATKFHQRWMGSNDAKNNWCERASNMEIDMLCPQHGAIYQGDDVSRFINWFSELKVGVY